jgi:hypothetical protein
MIITCERFIMCSHHDRAPYGVIENITNVLV